jgi:hypothetical protein
MTPTEVEDALYERVVWTGQTTAIAMYCVIIEVEYVKWVGGLEQKITVLFDDNTTAEVNGPELQAIARTTPVPNPMTFDNTGRRVLDPKEVIKNLQRMMRDWDNGGRSSE